MTSPLDGWGIAETHLARTNDACATWHDVTPSGLTQVGYSIDAFFLDINRAWIISPVNYPVSGTLYRTTDGGVTWTSNPVPFSGGDIRFLDANNGWALADLGAGAGSNAVAVYQTTDGGATWTQSFTNDPNLPNASNSLPLGGIKSMLVPVNMQTAFIGGVTYSPATVYLYRSDDNGRAWSQVNLPLPPDTANAELAVADMKFFNADGFIALRVSSAAYRTAFYVTHDAGATWTLTPTLLDGAGATDILSPREIIFHNGNNFYVTTDAAATWSVISPDIVFGDSFAGMSFINPTTGWVIVADPMNNRAIYQTINGGKNWTPTVH